MGESDNRTLLVSLRSPFLDSDRVYPALANLYLKSAMEVEGLEAVVTDDWTHESLSRFSHIGVSIMTPQRDLAADFIQTVKKWHPEIVTIAGGPHAQFYTGELRNQDWDYIVRGDGERLLPQIVKGELPLPDARVSQDKLSRQELALMPPPDRLGTAEYLKQFNYVLQGRNSTTMLTARGCPEQCTFCEDAMTQVRRTPIEKIQQELDDIVKLGYGGVYIFDDIFALAPKVTEPICEELDRRDLIYRCNGQARMMTEPFMEMLANTGCVEIAFGAESGSQKILDNIRKRTTVEQNYKFVDWAHKNGINLKLFILLGLPGEDRQTLQETEKFIQYAQPADAQVAIYYPYKGTQIRDAIDANKSTVDLTFEGEGLGAYGQKGGQTESVVRTEALSSQELHEFRDYLVNTYRPKSHSAMLTNQRREEDAFFEGKL